MCRPVIQFENTEAFCKQKYTLKLLNAFKMAYSCCFNLGINLDFLDFLEKKIYNMNYRLTRLKEISLQPLPRSH